MPSLNTAIVYPGCIFEGTNMSEGRGTTLPFELIGAPYVNAEEYAQALNDLGLPGVIFRPALTPMFQTPEPVVRRRPGACDRPEKVPGGEDRLGDA